MRQDRRITRYSKDITRFRTFLKDVVTQTHFIVLTSLLFVLWALSSAGLYFVEREADGAVITSYGDALYWGVTAFSTAGLADAPVSGPGQLIGGAWIVLGSMLFFGTIIATITAYFMRPMETPARRIIDTIEDNLEKLDELSVEELALLKNMTDSLIEHVEGLKTAEESKDTAS